MAKEALLTSTNFEKNRKSNKNFNCPKKNTSTNIESIPRITNFGRVHTANVKKSRD